MKAMMAVAAVAAAGLGAGCAAIAASEPSVPTHRWVAQTDVSSAKYNFDNKLCAEQSMVDFHAPDVGHNGRDDGRHAAPGKGLENHADAGAPEFAEYQQCMQGKGYDLATY